MKLRSGRRKINKFESSREKTNEWSGSNKFQTTRERDGCGREGEKRRTGGGKNNKNQRANAQRKKQYKTL